MRIDSRNPNGIIVRVTTAISFLFICALVHASESVTVIKNVTVINGVMDEVLTGHDVIIQNGRITDIRDQSIEKKHTQGSIIDGQGGYLLPGFIDMHAHMLIPRCDYSSEESGIFDIPLSERMLRVLLHFGITTIRSPSNPTKDGLLLRDRLNNTRTKAPYIMAATEFINDARLSKQEIRDVIRGSISYRPDFVKIYAAIKPDVVASAIEESHSNGIRVIGHLQRTSWREAADMGIDFLTHAADWSPKSLSPDKREVYKAAIRERGPIKARLDWLELFDPNGLEATATIESIASAGVSIDPTLVAYDSKFTSPNSPRYRKNPNKNVLAELRKVWEACGTLTDNWTEDDFERWSKAYGKIQEFLLKLNDAGVLLTTGSDVPNSWVIPGEGLHQEFELLVEAGFSPKEVIQMATINGARALGLDAEIGSIDVGKQADLILLSKNPLEDISSTRSIQWVMVDGEVVN